MCSFGKPLMAQAPTIPYIDQYNIVTGNSLRAFNAINVPTTNEMTKNDIIDLMREKYGKNADLLICMIRKESQFDQYAIGDGSLAHGLMQIHIDKHPVTEWCAFDVECSSDYTVKLIREGKGYLWTSYFPCVYETDINKV